MASDERISGSDFVESTLGQCEPEEPPNGISIDDVLSEVSVRTGVSSEEIIGASRSHIIAKARREFDVCAHEKPGATLAALAKMTGRTHVAVFLAIEEAKKDRSGGK